MVVCVSRLIPFIAVGELRITGVAKYKHFYGTHLHIFIVFRLWFDAKCSHAHIHTQSTLQNHLTNDKRKRVDNLHIICMYTNGFCKKKNGMLPFATKYVFVTFKHSTWRIGLLMSIIIIVMWSSPSSSTHMNKFQFKWLFFFFRFISKFHCYRWNLG